MGNTGEAGESRGGVNYLNTVLIYENLKNKLNIEKNKSPLFFNVHYFVFLNSK